LFAACTGDIPIYRIKAFRYRTVPHGSFAAVQDDTANRSILEDGRQTAASLPFRMTSRIELLTIQNDISLL